MKGKYEKYKDSGVEWIGEIPNHWGITKFKHISNLYTGNSINENIKGEKYSNLREGFNYIATKDIDMSSSIINYENGIKIPFVENNFKIAPKNSTLICLEGGSAGKKIGFLSEDVCFINKLMCLNSIDENLSKYLYYVCKSNNFNQLFNSYISGLIGGVSISTFKEFQLPISNGNEINTIINYLDNNVCKIDTLIDKKKQLINSLKDTKQSLISEVVTKGLNPNVEYKDSGIEWIDLIPKHWDLRKFKINHKSDVKSNIQAGEGLNDGCYNFYTSSQKNIKKYNKALYNKESLILGTGGSASIHYTNNPFSTSTDCLVINSKHYLKYNYYFLLSNLSIINDLGFEGMGLKHLQRYFLFNIKLPTPPVEEQIEIANYLDTKVSKIDTLISKLEEQIKSIENTKKSLINEVVTGKVKVC